MSKKKAPDSTVPDRDWKTMYEELLADREADVAGMNTEIRRLRDELLQRERSEKGAGVIADRLSAAISPMAKAIESLAIWASNHE